MFFFKILRKKVVRPFDFFGLLLNQCIDFVIYDLKSTYIGINLLTDIEIRISRINVVMHCSLLCYQIMGWINNTVINERVRSYFCNYILLYRYF